MGAMYILPKPGEHESDLPQWIQDHNREQHEAEQANRSQDDKRSQENWGYKR
jgi:hypothetical protein